MSEARGALDDGERLARRRAGLRPNTTAYSLKALRTGHPFADPDNFDRLVEALQKAGWQGA
jgi:hypothetical protein